MSDPPFGPECLVVIAAPANNPPVDFSALAQPGLRAREGCGFEPKPPVATGGTAGIRDVPVRLPPRAEPVVADQNGMRILTWRTEPK